MAHFWKWLGLSALCAAVIYGALIGLSAFQIPWRSPHFDTAAATTTQPGWVNEARYFMLNKQAFAAPGDRIVVIGASSAREPFRPGLMEDRLPGWQVANASLSGATINEIADAVDLYYQERSSEDGRTVFVLALHYIQFLPVSYGEGNDNPLATEAMRNGLYTRINRRLQPRYPEGVERTVEVVSRPQAVAASMPRRLFRSIFVNPRLPAIKKVVDQFREDDPLSRWVKYIGEHEDLDTISVPVDVQQALLAQRLAVAGGDHPLPAESFDALAHLTRQVRAHGDGVVIVDLPLPEWHLAGVPVMDASYQAGVAKIVSFYQGDGAVARVSLREFDDNENFFDSGHAEPRLWPEMSAALADRLAPLVTPLRTRSGN